MASAKALGQEHAWYERRAEIQPEGLEQRVRGGPAASGWRGVWVGSQASASCVMGVERAGTAVVGCGRTHALTTVGQRSSWVRSRLNISVLLTPSAAAFSRSPMTRREGYSHPPLPLSRALLPLAFPVTPKPCGVSSGAPSPSSPLEASWCVIFFVHLLHARCWARPFMCGYEVSAHFTDEKTELGKGIQLRVHA